jgi:hypothetical protein
MSRDDIENHTDLVKFKVDVSPEMRIYRILQHLNYNLETAFAEFIDNSIQSYLERSEELERGTSESTPKLKISIEISTIKNQIVIKDNAGGIHRRDIDRALKLGVDLGTIHSAESLSVYGIGMKSAAIWFSDDWTVNTSAIGINEKLGFDFNLNTLLDNNQTDADVTPESAGAAEHYTEIVLRNHIRPESIEHYQDTIIPYVEETFHKFANFTTIEFYYDDVLLNANKKKVSTSMPSVLEYPAVNSKGLIESESLIRWHLKLDFKYLGRKVSGFIMIRVKGSYGQPGIRLLRNNRVIEGTSISPNYPTSLLKTKNKFSAQRVYGELHLDSFPVDFMKTNFNENLKDFYEKINKIITKNYPVNLIYQADNLRVRNIPESEKELLKKIKSKVKITNINDIGEGHLIKSDSSDDSGSAVIPDSSDNSGSAVIPDSIDDSDSAVITDSSDNSSTAGRPDSTDASGLPDSPGASFEPRPENRVEFSETLNDALKKLPGNKSEHLYSSLCTISLKKHSVLTYVGAWSFLEMLTSLLGRNTNASFPDFLGTKVNEYTKDKSIKGELKRVISDISTRGNCTKHSGIYWNHTAMDLKPAFIILEPFIVYLVCNYDKKSVKTG